MSATSHPKSAFTCVEDPYGIPGRSIMGDQFRRTLKIGHWTPGSRWRDQRGQDWRVLGTVGQPQRVERIGR